MHPEALESSADLSGEYRVFGPPGCGKTTWMARNVGLAADRYGTNAVLVTSFSRAAAAEIAGRGLGINRDMVGTLHSHCFRALGCPKIATAPENVREWNEIYPALSISPSKKQAGEADDADDTDDPGEGASGQSGDDYLAQVNKLRGQIAPAFLYNANQTEFRKRWEAYKKERHLLDFTDLIEVALREYPIAPGNPQVIFADEAQDLNPMQGNLIRRWGHNARYFILAGDDDQLIFPHLGCMPEVLMTPVLPADHIRVLKQSYRVPRAVHALSQEWIEKVMTRQPKEYLPRDFEGGVTKMPVTFRQPHRFAQRLNQIEKDGETLMILAACSYQLQGIIKWLREQGVPFHNPYRRGAFHWNPLSRKPGSSVGRLLALLAAHQEGGGRSWSNQEFYWLVEWMEAKRSGLNNGAKKYLAEMARANPEGEATPARVAEVLSPEALEAMIAALEGPMTGLADWWRDRLLGEPQKRTLFAARILAARGAQALDAPPKVIVGTIHSVKGGEADHVLLFPDVSPLGHRQMESSWDGLDSTLRQFYVGMTRAKQTLVLAEPTGSTSVTWNAHRYRRSLNKLPVAEVSH